MFDKSHKKADKQVQTTLKANPIAKNHPFLEKICIIIVSSMWQPHISWVMFSSFFKSVQHLIQYVLQRTTCKGVETRAFSLGQDDVCCE
jgi:hypothetical protein